VKDGAADTTSLKQVEAERSDNFQEAVQRRLIELTGDDGDLAAAGHGQIGECGDRGFVKLTRDADLVGGLGSHQAEMAASSITIPRSWRP
jgi:hypothetical protein